MKTLLSLFTHRFFSSRNFSLFYYSGALKKGITYDPFALLLTLEHNLFQEFIGELEDQMELFLCAVLNIWKPGTGRFTKPTFCTDWEVSISFGLGEGYGEREGLVGRGDRRSKLSNLNGQRSDPWENPLCSLVSFRGPLARDNSRSISTKWSMWTACSQASPRQRLP